MATSGSFETNSYSQKRNLVFTWKRTNVSVEGNYSDIHWSLKGGGVDNGKYYYLHGTYLGITYNNGNEKKYYDIYSKNDANKQLKYNTEAASGDIRIYHESDGTADFEVALSGAIYTFAINCTGGQKFYLDSIPRATSCPNLSGNIGTSVTAAINGASSSFTHKLEYSFGSLYGEIPIGSGWTIPNDFYYQIPNSKSGEGVLTLITYSNGSEIGRKSGKLYVYCEEYACIPDGSATIIDCNSDTIALTGDKNKIIKGKSSAYIEYYVSAKNGASIKNVMIAGSYVDNYSSNILLTHAQNSVYSMRVEDSRGYVRDIIIGNPNNLVNYNAPTNNLVIKRNNATGDKIFCDITGNVFNQSFGGVSNSLKVEWRVKESSGLFSEYQRIGLYDVLFNGNTFTINKELINPLRDNKWNYQKQYTFEILVTDKLSTYTSTFVLKKGKPNHNWYEKNGKNFLNVNGSFLLNDIDIIDIIYPIGIEVTFFDDLDHSNFCDRSWALVSGGKVDVGRDYSDNSFLHVGYTGGSYQLQRHSHSFSAESSKTDLIGKTGVIYSGANADSELELGIFSAEVVSYRQYDTAGERNNKWIKWKINASHTHSISGTTTSAGDGYNNMQPYEVKSKWRRIS